MAKIYKVSLYAIDYNDEYKNGKHFKNELIEQIYDLWVGIDHLKVDESREFEWDDDLTINKIDTRKEDYEVYFKKKD